MTYIKHPELYAELQSSPYFGKYYTSHYQELVVSLFYELLNNEQRDEILSVDTPIGALELLIELDIPFQTKCPTRCSVCFDREGNESEETC
jgi:hypothetical protein